MHAPCLCHCTTGHALCRHTGRQGVTTSVSPTAHNASMCTQTRTNTRILVTNAKTNATPVLEAADMPACEKQSRRHAYTNNKDAKRNVTALLATCTQKHTCTQSVFMTSYGPEAQHDEQDMQNNDEHMRRSTLRIRQHLLTIEWKRFFGESTKRRRCHLHARSSSMVGAAIPGA